MTTYRRPTQNVGIIDNKKKKKKYMSSDDIFDLIVSSFIAGLATGFLISVILFINA